MARLAEKRHKLAGRSLARHRFEDRWSDLQLAMKAAGDIVKYFDDGRATAAVAVLALEAALDEYRDKLDAQDSMSFKLDFEAPSL